MISAVLLFGVMNALFEFVLLSMIPPRLRLRLLGSTGASNALHSGFLLVNVIIHWGTLIGTMSGVFAFIVSIVTVAFARKLFGRIEADRYYHVGWCKYAPEDLK